MKCSKTLHLVCTWVYSFKVHYIYNLHTFKKKYWSVLHVCLEKVKGRAFKVFVHQPFGFYYQLNYHVRLQTWALVLPVIYWYCSNTTHWSRLSDHQLGTSWHYICSCVVLDLLLICSDTSASLGMWEWRSMFESQCTSSIY